jgi:hypothetical protein
MYYTALYYYGTVTVGGYPTCTSTRGDDFAAISQRDTARMVQPFGVYYRGRISHGTFKTAIGNYQIARALNPNR